MHSVMTLMSQYAWGTANVLGADLRRLGKIQYARDEPIRSEMSQCTRGKTDVLQEEPMRSG